MKLGQLRIRGSGFTFGQVVSNDDHFYFRSLLDYLQNQYGEDEEVQGLNFRFEHVNLPKKETFPVYQDAQFHELKEKGIENGYLIKNSDGSMTFTQKATEVFEKVIEIDNHLTEQGFQNIPCQGGCR